MGEVSHIKRLTEGLGEVELRRAIGSIGKNAECLKKSSQASVWKVRLEGRAVVVKQWSLTRPKRRLQAFLRSTPAYRHWQSATWLEEANIPTAACLAIARGRDERGASEWLVMEFVEGKTVLQHLADGDLSPCQEHRLGEALGRLVGEYELNKTRNRDTKPSNLIVRELPRDADREDDGPRAADWLVVIDPDLAYSGRSKKHPLLSSLAECVGTGCLARRAVLMRVLWAMEEHRARINQEDDRTPDPASVRSCRHFAWRTLLVELARHGDPTPKTNPLDPPSHRPLP